MWHKKTNKQNKTNTATYQQGNTKTLKNREITSKQTGAKRNITLRTLNKQPQQFIMHILGYTEVVLCYYCVFRLPLAFVNNNTPPPDKIRQTVMKASSWSAHHPMTRLTSFTRTYTMEDYIYIYIYTRYQVSRTEGHKAKEGKIQ